MSLDHGQDPHAESPVLWSGEPVLSATGALILLHGRGASAEDILSLASEIGHQGLAYVAPHAFRSAWYPLSFLAPRSENEPWLSSALRKVQSVLDSVRDAGIPAERTFLCGFSQGACLATEFVAEHPKRYGGLVAFTGGLVGPLNAHFEFEGNLAEMPALFGSGDPDPHVPWSRVEQSAAILSGMGAVVVLRKYPGRLHTVSRDEIELARELIRGVLY
jgi:phospholipase/carboxylesterase